MTQIANARSFDGVDDKITVLPASAPAFGSIVLLLKRIAGDSGSFRTLYAAKEGPSGDGAVLHDNSTITLYSGGLNANAGVPTIAEG